MQAPHRGNAAVASDTLRRGQGSRGTDLTNRVAAGCNPRRALRRLRPPEGVCILPFSHPLEHLDLLMVARYKATSARYPMTPDHQNSNIASWEAVAADAGDLLELADLPELPAHAATGRCRKFRKDLEQCRAVQTKHMRLGFFRKEALRYNVWRYMIHM